MLRFKNTILLNKPGSNKLLFAVMWFPASEKSRSEATEVKIQQREFTLFINLYYGLELN